MLKQQSGSDDGISALDARMAAVSDPEQLQKFLRRHNVPIDHFINGKRTFLMNTIGTPNPERLRTIFLFNPDLFLLSRDEFKETVVHTTARERAPKHLRVLLEEADKKGYLVKAVNCRDGSGNTPLISASQPITETQDRLEETFDVLLEFGADPTIANDTGELPMKFLEGRPHLQQKLTAQIEKQKQQKLTHTIPSSKPQIPPKPNQRRNSLEANRGTAAFFQNTGPSRQKTPSPPQEIEGSGSRSSGSEEAARPSALPQKQLNKLGEEDDYSINDSEIINHFYDAIKHNKIEKVKIIFDCPGFNNIRFDFRDRASGKEFSSTPLYLACSLGHSEIAKLLIEHGADVNSLNDICDATPLGIAVAGGFYDLAIYLLEHGANPNISEKIHGSVPLHIACSRNEAKGLVRKLLECGADPNVKIKQGYTPLMLATDSDIEISRLLVAAGADVDILSPHETTAVIDALNAGKKDLYEFLKSHSKHDSSSSVQQSAAMAKLGVATNAGKERSHQGRVDDKKCLVM